MKNYSNEKTAGRVSASSKTPSGNAPLCLPERLASEYSGVDSEYNDEVSTPHSEKIKKEKSILRKNEKREKKMFYLMKTLIFKCIKNREQKNPLRTFGKSQKGMPNG